MTYDTLYYWAGGREVGSWNAVVRPYEGLDDARAKIEKAGYVCVKGCESIGAPEGPPADERFKALGL
ncbi:MAG: hypothetical protein ACYSWO_30445 [Planctomycetota bacterium]|jgi:hypothetical protein